MRHAVVCPGSRNAPVLLALHGDPRITCWSVLDERAAGFMALGIAKATGTPAAVCVTSGTAVSNLLPAATEAHEAGVPVLLLTADRPPELRDGGAGQTIDQLRALDHVCRWVIEADLGDASAARERWVRSTTCRAVHATRGAGRPGPVQVNLPLREPLTHPEPAAPLTAGRDDGAPWLAVTRAEGTDPRAINELAGRCLGAHRGVIIAGRSETSPELAALLPRLAAALDWPLLADPMSGARRGPHAVAGYDVLLSGERHRELIPELVLRVGDLPVSKPLRAWLAGPAAGAAQVLLTPEAVWSDPDAAASDWLTGNPGLLVRALTSAISGAREGASDERAGLAEHGWTQQWIETAADALDAAKGAPLHHATVEPGHPDPAASAPLTEALVAETLATALPAGASLVVGASLPIRMLERWAPAIDSPPRVLSNRGANGIDGVVSTAFGVLAAGAGPVFAYIGDLTLLYDQGGLAGASRLGRPLQLVVVNNHGGRIFDRLPVAEHASQDVMEALITTPHDVDLAQLAAFHRLEHHTPQTVGALTELLARPADRARLIEVRVGAAA